MLTIQCSPCDSPERCVWVGSRHGTRQFSDFWMPVVYESLLPHHYKHWRVWGPLTQIYPKPTHFFPIWLASWVHDTGALHSNDRSEAILLNWNASQLKPCGLAYFSRQHRSAMFQDVLLWQVCFRLKSDLKCCCDHTLLKEFKKKKSTVCALIIPLCGREHLTHYLSSFDCIFKRALLYAVCVWGMCWYCVMWIQTMHL